MSSPRWMWALMSGGGEEGGPQPFSARDSTVKVPAVSAQSRPLPRVMAVHRGLPDDVSCTPQGAGAVRKLQ